MSDWLGGIGSFLSSNSNWLAPAAMAGASIYGASQNSAAAQTQANALQGATATNAAAQQQALAMQEPWRQAGQQALGQMLPQVTGGFQQTPGYQWTQNEAMRGVQNSAAARGMLNSGATMKALQDRAGNLANQEYGNYWNRLAGVAGVGQTAVNNSSNIATQGAQTIGQLQGQVGNALANGQTAGANNLMSGANNLLGYYGRQQQPQGYGYGQQADVSGWGGYAPTPGLLTMANGG